MIIAINGKAGSGKDTAADFLVQHHSFVKVALADPIKRICKDVFGFSFEQLWGPSERRNEPDKRYPNGLTDLFGWVCDPCRVSMHGDKPVEEKSIGGLLKPTSCSVCGEVLENSRLRYIRTPVFLTPRHALQQLGTEWGRECYPPIWIDYAMRTAKRILSEESVRYEAALGVIPWDAPQPHVQGVVVSDVRFLNEVNAFRERGAKLVRIRRPGQSGGVSFAARASEAEQDSIPDSAFDFVIENDGTVEELYLKIHHVFLALAKEDEDNKNLEAFAQALSEPGAYVSSVTYEPSDVIVQEKLDVQFERAVPLGHGEIIKTEDGVEVLPADYTPQSAGLQKLLDQRAEDVRSGRLLEYDPSQADIPPFKRK